MIFISGIKREILTKNTISLSFKTPFKNALDWFQLEHTLEITFKWHEHYYYLINIKDYADTIMYDNEADGIHWGKI